ncbi:phospho-N-acetylmuramoyl-pentapeptide-transferase [Ethanoligenens harbinense]|uniref:Phospho-N-acetylmuramoyl-pentapeptide-transferase n=1 Tax=Ethanoligenens harbinense (strain DSM 18485 / JCM 12961 / CGMCC 1.5033 / YUAN-3) TaxID=663278 RepID=E6U398_ETHHY|nr:phospho-N-acetylmuramoyl-pentapeptide-transferase [Ethanoligenens harbinense]ADU27570.1 phospho-N-acetylmuramoyl-pentapeptide-transferase [Ethanoligenens harbinense YUAN-3]AVQ96616.1 phospho-N-acetylmuramoyl-pentapeptide-transferase [Ethanoligenens harbinense YUAN-3]AYF39277.1 phospho-N-acetylmuramoyl-pentapeptide-transferase [Ethanoligenens harbinense]AYF42101.1 phospho-N-acetylmuramoyl-pentapeptide-transferase [Ethanoligenens harbinense]QCN92856.1 phospho-N-acetylmuramoyl-pentapeptide-tra
MTDTVVLLAGVLAFAISGLSGIFFIPYLKKIKAGQSIRDVGPTWHKKKQGTPTMGGFLFICGTVLGMALAYLICSRLLHVGAALSSSQKIKLVGGIIMALLFGFIGFMDDYVKVVKKRNLGLTARQKSVLQLCAAVVFLIVMYLAGDRPSTMLIPFLNVQLRLGVLYWPFAALIIVGTVNAVNLTDGIDGLCGSVTMIVAIAFLLCSKIVSYAGFAALSAALAGGCLGFLVWNFHPARVFMGDTGSLFLGGLLCALAFGIGQPLILVPLGIIYIVETLSVIIQVISFKTTGKRVFKMSPIHHHFELSGWKENKIVLIFSLVTILCSAAAVAWLAVYMGLF